MIIFRRPYNLLYFQKHKKIYFKCLNYPSNYFQFNENTKKIIKKKLHFKNSNIKKLNDSLFAETENNKILIKNLTNNKKKKIQLTSGFEVVDLILENNIFKIFGYDKKNNYIVEITEGKKKYKKTKFNIDNLKFFNNDKDIYALNTLKAKLYKLNNNKLEYIFGKYSRVGRYSFRDPSSLSFSNNLLAINDRGNYKIKFYDKNFKFLRYFGDKGVSKQNLDFAADISFGSDDDLYIADTNNDRILKISKKKKSDIIIKDNFKNGFFRRPMKSIEHDNGFIILDRDNKCLQIFNNNFVFLRSLNISKQKNSKPNSMCSVKYKNKIYVVVLCRYSDFNNYLEFYNSKLDFLYSKKILTMDAQDIEYKDGLFWVADTLGRKVRIYEFNLKLKKTIDMKKISKNNRILIKSVTSSEQFMITVDFDKCNIFLFNFFGILKKIIRFNKFKKELKVIRSAKLIDKNLFILSRNNQPIWIYNFKSKKIKRHFKFGIGNDKFCNPVYISKFEDKLMIIDKENDQIKFVNNNLKIEHLIPKSIN
jgi:hypothetical protein